MDDTLDARGPHGPSATARVNKREVKFELATGRILNGPPAIVGKWICTEQLADVLAHPGGVIDHLFTADDEDGLRLARVDYLTSKRREEKGEFAVQSHVQYGKHGVFRVVSFDANKQLYTLTSGGREITVPRERLEAEGRVLNRDDPPVEAKPRVDFDKYRTPSEELAGEGSIEIDDADMQALVAVAVDKYIAENADKIIEALKNHSAAGGKDHSVQ